MKLSIAPRMFVERISDLTIYEEAYSLARKKFEHLRNEPPRFWASAFLWSCSMFLDIDTAML
jgi:hypothetical protein